MYSNPRALSPEEKRKYQRTIMMQQNAYESDLRKLERKAVDLKDEERRFHKKIAEIQAYVRDTQEMQHDLDRKREYLNGELRKLKKQLIELG